MQKRIAAAILAVLMTLTAAISASCGGKAATDRQTETTSQSATDDVSQTAEETELSDELPEMDYEEASFTSYIRSEEQYIAEFDVQKENGDVLNDAVYRRNIAVEERFNVKLEYIETPSTYPSFGNNAEASILAGDALFQLLGGKTYHLAANAFGGAYLNWYAMPYINLEKPWWSKGFLDAASIKEKTYIATGDLSMTFLESTFAIFFNKVLAKDNNINDEYQLVKNGEWTFDKMAEYIAVVQSDLNGDGKMDKNDQFGYHTGRYTQIDAFLYALEVPLTKRDDEGIPTVIGVTEKYQSVIEKLYALIYDSNAVFYDGNYQNSATSIFPNGTVLFEPAELSAAVIWRAMDADFGIIPYPKWDENQLDYHTYYSDSCTSFLIPVTVEDTDYVGTIIEALAAESYRQVRPAVYNVALKTKYARDDDSQEMIDKILGSMIFDFTNIFALSFGDQQSPAHSLRMCLLNKSTDLASYFAEKESSYTEIMRNFVELAEAIN